MPNLTELPVQPLLMISVVVILLTALAGWLYASGGVSRGTSYRSRTARRPRTVVYEDEEPTRPIRVSDGAAAPMRTVNRHARRPRRGANARLSWLPKRAVVRAR